MILFLGSVLLLASCTTMNGSVNLPAGSLPKPKVALVLGGGAARGFAHIGVIRALEQEKIPVDLVVGTSVGSLIGAIYAHDRNSFELEWTAFALEKDDIFDYGLLNAFTGMGAAKGEKLESFVKSKVPVANIEELKVPFAAVATDLNRGTRVILDTGSVGRAVRASSALPGVFQPVEHQGRLLVDGGVSDNVPASVAREKGADIVIAVDIGKQVSNFNIVDIIDVMLQSITVMSSENAKFRKQEADILIAPNIGDVGMLDFTQKKRCMQAGVDATQKMMPEIKAKIEAWGRNKLARK
ncbi:MAG: patatin-like phospholipase family protein [Desulfuromonadales bacterium]|nr:patatin-like phospholipase family protein [Desulfuromonadales bacterium]